jgi:hypothetical protein
VDAHDQKVTAVETQGDQLVAAGHGASDEIKTMVAALRADQAALKAAVDGAQKRVRLRLCWRKGNRHH